MAATTRLRGSLFAAVVKKETGFLSRRKEENIGKEKDVNLVLACPKISSYFPHKSCALHLTISHSSV